MSDCYTCPQPLPASYGNPNPPTRAFCYDCRSSISNFFQPGFPGGGSGGGKDVELLEGNQIDIQDLSDSTTERFRISYVPYVALELALSINAKEGGVSYGNPVLLGRVIDEIVLSWIYNKPVTIQQFTEFGTLPDPNPLDAVDREFIYTGQSVTTDQAFTLQGNDGSGQPGGVVTDREIVTFGNFKIEGVGPNSFGDSVTDLQTLVENLPTKTLTTTQVGTLTPTNGVSERQYFAYPTRWGEAQFERDSFIGGFFRLKNVNGTIVNDIPAGQSESPIVINNGLASEPFYVYMSFYDNLVGTKDFNVTKL